ncbi:helix-turn-helix domain-containing protein [Fulvivirga imtechensis]|nr:AraC family transcriptional regulator [Fulvivirga imtechensis]
MSLYQVVLVLLSGLGVLHGLLLGVYLWFYPKGLPYSNKILSILLLVLSFRIGKSVLLEFVDQVYIQLIFIGLAALLLIGPLFYFYTLSVIEKRSVFSKTIIPHFFPAIIAIIFGVWINEDILKKIPIVAFIAIFGIYYGHYILYIVRGYRMIRKAKSRMEHPATIQWLTLLTVALVALWVVYVLNLLEENVPYVLGPVLYSVVVYGITFIVIKKDYINQPGNAKYKTTPLPEGEIDQIFDRAEKLLLKNNLYRNSDLTLRQLGGILKVSPQKLSMAVNTRFKSNFNDFVNHYRIKEAQQRMRNEEFKNHTIASVAYEVGFNSLTSFNSAFKKETGQTPSAYRKETS